MTNFSDLNILVLKFLALVSSPNNAIKILHLLIQILNYQNVIVINIFNFVVQNQCDLCLLMHYVINFVNVEIQHSLSCVEIHCRPANVQSTLSNQVYGRNLLSCIVPRRLHSVSYFTRDANNIYSLQLNDVL